MEVATTMCTLPPYHLQGLSDEKAWDLFELLAFAPGEVQKKLNLARVGKEIVRKCVNVPLAIRALGSLLNGKDESKWLSIKDTRLANISENQNSISIMSILKLSYHHLWSPLKNCFAYCALFPKDCRFKKETLIDLWMAEGFIIPTNESQSLEGLAEEYFLVLLQRCFFQETSRNEWGEITSCKMHDLMHELAQQVAGNKCKFIKVGESDYNKRIHHLSFAYRLASVWKIPSRMQNLKLLRTILLPKQLGDGSTFRKSTCQELISSFRCLRVLDLHHLGVTCLPSSIGQLVHLRYLNLSVTPIKALPDSVTELHNLQTNSVFVFEA
ncbi:putative disease resistance protein RGA4 [Chenopodium quinoa]|uniref:putative disease resistance protein RGA4 n=1 Tax=Chenopodium quinoa TaxID=63459 RepID=UPI000B796C5F|nr:putative disease resistance protein RGA4 [Chenopodium quinoa]